MWLADTTSAGALERRRTLTIAGTAFMQAREASATGNYERAATLLDRALAGYSSVEDQPWIGHCHMSLGNLRARQSSYPAAVEHFQEALTIFRGLGDRMNAAGAQMNLAYCLYEGGHADEAYRAALATIPEVPVDPGSAEILERTANLAIRTVETRNCDNAAKVGWLLDVAHPLIAHSPGVAGQPLLHIATLLGTLDEPEAGYDIAREAISRLDDAPDLKHQAVTLLTMLGSLFKDADDLRAELNVLL